MQANPSDITAAPGYTRLSGKARRAAAQPETPKEPARRNPASQTICVVTESTARSLEQALCWGWSVESACDYAGIPVHLYRRMIKRPELRERFEVLRQRPENIAKRNIAMSLEEGDVGTAKWYLERRVADFNPKAVIDVNVHQQVDEGNLIDALQALIAKSQRRAVAGGQEVLEDYDDLTQDTGDGDVIEAEMLSPTAQSYLD